jgi:hypothetical protein
VWSLDGTAIAAWFLEYHGGPLAKLFAFTMASLLVVALGAQGAAARLLTLAFLLIGAADAGPLLGAERSMAFLAPATVAFNWLAVPLAFPVICLAVMGYEMLTGRLPFGGSPTEGPGRPAEGPGRPAERPGRPLAAIPLPPALEAVLQRAMSLQRDERPRTARALANALRRRAGQNIEPAALTAPDASDGFIEHLQPLRRTTSRVSTSKPGPPYRFVA